MSSNKTKVLFATTLILSIAIMLMLAYGCGHNVVTYSDGIGLETTVNPETYTLGINIRYGKLLTLAVKEKTELSMESGFNSGTSAGTANESKTALDSKLTFKTGDQITGYTVDLEKAKQSSASTSTDSPAR